MGRPSHAALVRLFEEARAVLLTQREALQALDEKSAQLLRFNALVVGLILTSLSFLVGEGSPVSHGGWMVLGSLLIAFVLLLSSTASALVAHRAERFRIGLRSQGLVDALAYEIQEDLVLVEAIRSYHAGIVDNREIRDRSVAHLRRASWLLLAAVFFIAVSSIALLVRRLP